MSTEENKQPGNGEGELDPEYREVLEKRRQEHFGAPEEYGVSMKDAKAFSLKDKGLLGLLPKYEHLVRVKGGEWDNPGWKRVARYVKMAKFARVLNLLSQVFLLVTILFSVILPFALPEGSYFSNWENGFWVGAIPLVICVALMFAFFRLRIKALEEFDVYASTYVKGLRRQSDNK